MALGGAGLVVGSALLQWATLVWAVLPWGSRVFLLLAPVWGIVLVAAWCGAPLSLWTLYSAHRSEARKVAVNSLVVCCSVALGTLGGCVRGWHDRVLHLRRAVDASRPLTQAVHDFERIVGRPPGELSALVPRYLPAVPPTGMGGYAEWIYVVGPAAYEGNNWDLRVRTGIGLNFDQLVYLPNQRYPASCCGGELQRVGTWAYVHE
jgi:hypothetical protein